MQASKCPCNGCSGNGGYVSPDKQSQSKQSMYDTYHKIL